jgi:hypothetical protein
MVHRSAAFSSTLNLHSMICTRISKFKIDVCLCVGFIWVAGSYRTFIWHVMLVCCYPPYLCCIQWCNEYIGDIEQLRYLLSNGADINKQTEQVKNKLSLH